MDYEVNFQTGGVGLQYLIAGWSHHEEDYTWTLGRLSVVRFPEINVKSDYTLKFSGTPFIKKGKIEFQRLFIDVAGINVARLMLRGAIDIELFLPSHVLGRGPAVEIVFHLPDARSPAHVTETADSRDLAVAMTALRLQRFALIATVGIPNTTAADRALLMEIQSLGENCELAFVQRLYGAEPFGLFRWAATPLAKLLPALHARFEGLGRPQYLDAEIDDASEYQIIDKKYGFKNHSFAYDYNGIKKGDILKREAVRLPFMARLLCKELERANRLFCFHDAGTSSREEVERLVAAIGAYGPNTLLWVVPAASLAQAGTAEWLHDRLICGYLDRFETIDKVIEPSYEVWMKLLRAAHAMWSSRR